MKIGNSIQAHGRDPWITKHDGLYHYCFTDAPRNRAIYIASAPSLALLGEAEAVCVWQAPDEGLYSGDYWAPELHFIEGAWYIYVAAGDRKNDALYLTQRMHVLTSPGVNPQSAFTYVCKIEEPQDRWAIDGTILEWGGARYLVWSTWLHGPAHSQSLVIAKMESPWKIVGEPVCIAAPAYEWEQKSLPFVPFGINEAPQVLQKDEKLFLLFSASGSWTEHYCIGLLEFVGVDPLDARSWRKHHEPVFASSTELFGPGHACIVADVEARLVFHAGSTKNAGWKTDVYAQPISFTSESVPYFGTPERGKP